MSLDISCKCITYGRVDLLEEALNSFLKQEYDGNRELLIINDYPKQKLHFDHPDVRIINLDKTFPTIGAKENFAVDMCKYDTIAVWDDDDIALPNHLSNINKYFPDHDLLHWYKGAAVNDGKISTLHCLGNSGIVYSKDIWEKAGRHALENAGYDMTFVMKIRGELMCRTVDADPPDDEVSWMYLWGGRCYHMSGQGSDKTNDENVLVRHARHIEEMRKAGKIPVGDIELCPQWGVDYIDLLKKYNEAAV